MFSSSMKVNHFHLPEPSWSVSSLGKPVLALFCSCLKFTVLLVVEVLSAYHGINSSVAIRTDYDVTMLQCKAHINYPLK